MTSTPSASKRTVSNTMPRRINSGLVLAAVRKHQPISRVELSRVSGIQPSTISLVVEELVEDGWLVEGEVVKGAMGRRPTLLSLSTSRCVIAVDVHPKRTAIAVVDVAGNIRRQSDIALPADPSQAIRKLAQAVKQMVNEQADCTFEGIGVCLPGRTDTSAEDLVFAPNLRWPTVKLRNQLERITGLPVQMDNVANACASLEVFEAQREEQHDLVVVEVSEGLGTGIFINGAIARGAGGMAGEFGHIRMLEDGPPCNCGNRGCWEALASNRALLRRFRELKGTRRTQSFDDVLALAQAGDRAALEAFSYMACNLGRGLQMVAAALAPFEIVIVGDITKAWAMVEPQLMAELRKHTLARHVCIRPSHDGDSTRLRSAVALVLADRFLSTPALPGQASRRVRR